VFEVEENNKIVVRIKEIVTNGEVVKYETKVKLSPISRDVSIQPFINTFKFDVAKKGITSMVKDAKTLENVVVEEDENIATTDNVVEEYKGIE